MESLYKMHFNEDVFGLYRGKEKLIFPNGLTCWIWIRRNNVDWACFRRMILKTHGTKCEECGDGEHILHVHHIIPVKENPSLCFDKNNCIVLCESCHKKKHSGKRIGEDGDFDG